MSASASRSAGRAGLGDGKGREADDHSGGILFQGTNNSLVVESAQIEAISPPAASPAVNIAAKAAAKALADLIDAPPPPPPPPQRPALPGQFVPPAQIDEYQIIQPLGRGGMGQVFLGKDTLLERPVAVKFLVSNNPTERARKRFLVEARAIARLQHPNIVGIYRVGISAGHPYLVSELVAGKSLDAAGAPIPWERALRIGIDMARGLAAVHAHGILHRDIKPANVMLTDEGVAKLLDFGLAKVTDDLTPAAVPDGFIYDSPPEPLSVDSPEGLAAAVLPRVVAQEPPREPPPLHQSPQHGLTKDGEVIGTPMYMPPEMWRGHPATAQSDVYMIGTVLYQLCCGVPPHKYNQERLLRQAVLHRDAVPILQRNPTMNTEFAALIDRCISRDPDRRPRSAEGLLKALQEIATSLTQPTLPPKSRWPNKWMFALGSIALVLATTSVLLLRRPPQNGAELTAPFNRPRPRVALLGLSAPIDAAGRSQRFARAFTELLSNELAAGQNMLVLAGERVEHMKVELGLSDTASFAQNSLGLIRRNLGADQVVVGTLRRIATSGDAMAIQLTVQDTTSGEAVANVEVRGMPSDMFAMVSRAGSTLRQQLGMQSLSSAESGGVRAARPSSPAVAELYAEGRTRLRHFDPVSARKLFEDVVEADPDFALGHLALAEALSALGHEKPARAAIARAFELSHPLRREDRYLIEARYYESKEDWPRAFALYQALQTFLPDNLDYGIYLAEAQIHAGEAGDALSTVARLRKNGAPLSEDPRIDIVEAQAQMERSQFTEGIALLQRAALRGEAIGANLVRAKALSLEAWALTNMGHHERARRSAEHARILYDAAGDSFGVVDTLLATGSAATAQGELELAQQVKQETLERLIEMRDEVFTATHLGNMANLLIQRGDLIQATARAEAGLLLGRRDGNHEAAVQALVILGNVAYQRGKLALAERRFDQAREELGAGGDPRQNAWIDWQMGQLRLAQGRLEEALLLHHQSLAQRERLKLEGFVAESRMALALLAAEQGRPRDAEPLARAALAHFISENRADSVAWAQALLSHILWLQNRGAEAEQARGAAMQRLVQTQDVLLRLRLLALLGRHAPAQPEERIRLLAALREGLATARKSELVVDEIELDLVLHTLTPNPSPPLGHPTHELSQRCESLGLFWLARRAFEAGL